MANLRVESFGGGRRTGEAIEAKSGSMFLADLRRTRRHLPRRLARLGGDDLYRGQVAIRAVRALKWNERDVPPRRAVFVRRHRSPHLRDLPCHGFGGRGQRAKQRFRRARRRTRPPPNLRPQTTRQLLPRRIHKANATVPIQHEQRLRGILKQRTPTHPRRRRIVGCGRCDSGHSVSLQVFSSRRSGDTLAYWEPNQLRNGNCSRFVAPRCLRSEARAISSFDRVRSDTAGFDLSVSRSWFQSAWSRCLFHRPLDYWR